MATTNVIVVHQASANATVVVDTDDPDALGVVCRDLVGENPEAQLILTAATHETSV